MNSVVHFEIPIKDVTRAKDFYSKLFDWKLDEWPGTTDPYVMATTTETGDAGPKNPGAINGGLTAEKGLTSTVVVIDVPDLDTHLAKATEMGAKTVMPKLDMGMGLYARIEDSEGNIIGLWQNKPAVK